MISIEKSFNQFLLREKMNENKKRNENMSISTNSTAYC